MWYIIHVIQVISTINRAQIINDAWSFARWVRFEHGLSVSDVYGISYMKNIIYRVISDQRDLDEDT